MRTLRDKAAIWNPTTIIRGTDFLKTATELRARPGGYIYVYGSATMIRLLLAAGLVDELLLTIELIVLGGGKTIFVENGKALPFTLESTTQVSTGRRFAGMLVLGSAFLRRRTLRSKGR